MACLDMRTNRVIEHSKISGVPKCNLRVSICLQGSCAKPNVFNNIARRGKHTFAAGVAVAADLALVGDARLDGPVALVRVQARDGHDARRRFVARYWPVALVARILPIAATTASTVASCMTRRFIIPTDNYLHSIPTQTAGNYKIVCNCIDVNTAADKKMSHPH